MDHTEILTRYIANFVDELVQNGLTDVVISPGSRSTPLAMTMTEHPSIKEWVVIDERSAAFFGLGIAKQSNRPVAIVCTSGTAAANYFPAIVEAYYSRVPLIIITADRPHELRDVGAPQAIEQVKLYGDYVKWFHEMALPEATPKMLDYVRRQAARAVYLAGEGNGGPVHLNFPLREPLVPDFTLEHIWGAPSINESYAPVYDGSKRMSQPQLQQLIEKLQTRQKGLIVCGPQTNGEFAPVIAELAEAWGIPVLADPLSQLRAGSHQKANIIEGYDSFLKDRSIRDMLRPDFIIRFGAMPVSKSYLFFVQEHKAATQFIVETNAGYREPAGNASEFIYADPISFCQDLLGAANGLQFDRAWLKAWQKMNEITKACTVEHSDQHITEGGAVRGLLEVIPDQSSLYVGNSMAVRDLDTFFMTTSKQLTIHANRGANGIDGMVSSGLGAAAVAGRPVTLLVGDLSFYHDLNGLLIAKQYGLNMTVLLINNNGGGIFSFLPQATNEKHFEALFGTPIDIEFRQAIEMYGGGYYTATSEVELKNVLTKSYQGSGLSVIEVKTDRTENLVWHRALWSEVSEKILHHES